MDAEKLLKSIKNKNKNVNFILNDPNFALEIIPLIKNVQNAKEIWFSIFKDSHFNIWDNSHHYNLLSLESLSVLIYIFENPGQVKKSIHVLEKKGYDLFELHEFLVNTFHIMSNGRNKIFIIRVLHIISNIILKAPNTEQQPIMRRLFGCFIP
ncbi:hypothetical protein DLEV_189 [Diachasmimorpha longicaudata entomopoxvirus]|uniref:Uncharacterized protein n=1 Tax=Diachasmimorpha longicaudata entomopoxvirus TaxID=109981 RepID=A0A7R5WGD4_9POXV|nr:hypothetical protein QKK69_gp189 [Diachasmimorpha longicaudata entomopoxvirus]AKS26480.1 hypothetical protein DLEV_189 [Diachasmimorpha longicaudata entomopoxvirus]